MVSFSKNDFLYFIAGFGVVALGLILIGSDPAPHGFGPLTLFVAPPLLIIGFILPVPGILGTSSRSVFFQNLLRWSPKNGFGILVFMVSLVIYLATAEPTASLWDCSEFIAAAYRLQVPHTPGTPLSLLLGRLFTMLSFGDTSKVAWTVNAMSGFFSALSVFMVYHLICHFAEKINNGPGTRSSLIIISAMGGSLILAFSDSFWFSAVEAETYGVSCFFLLLLTWLIVKGREKDEPIRSRWLVLVFYLGGLAYCIHPMSVLALCLVPFTWYLHDRKITLLNLTISILSGLSIVFLLNKLIAIGLFEAAFSLDLFFVNTMNLPFYSGAIFLATVLAGTFVWLLRSFKKHNVYIWSLLFLMLGFLPYLVLFVRSNLDPPIDETNPENLSLIKAYMNRESYPTSPLLFGPYFDARVESMEVRKDIYYKADNRYEKAGSMYSYQYEKKRNTFLPRIYSNDPNHIDTYRQWTGLKSGQRPTFADNIEFLFKYQIGHMYLRYLMFNFAGRESDIQNSNWLRPWDSLTLQTENPEKNAARNQYWMIPLMLGILGIFFHYRSDKKGFAQVAIFFLITGIILAVYLNSPPNEPRERDYIYVGSYIAFAIWIGVGLFSTFNLIRKAIPAIAVASVISIAFPVWMFIQNYDDHNRAGRTFQMDNARNTLNSCAPNSILFTGGDNDTFPLWYLQDVEGFRTDVRVMVLSYFNTDWYINQLRRKYYNSPAFRLSLSEDDYRQYGVNDVLYLDEQIKTPIDARKFLELLSKGHPSLRMVSAAGEPYNILPSRRLSIGIDKNNLVNDRYVKTKFPDQVKPQITLTVNGSYLQKNALAIIDLIVSNDWQRPLYFNFTSMNGLGLDVDPYLVQEGLVYRFVPVENPGKNITMDTEAAYRNLITNADYSNLTNASVNFNYEDFHARMIVPVRQCFNLLAVSLLHEGKRERSISVLNYAFQHLYHQHLRPSHTNLQAAEILMNLEEKQKAEILLQRLFDFHFQQARSQIEAGLTPDELDAYLLQKAAELLAKLGKTESQSQLDLLQPGG